MKGKTYLTQTFLHVKMEKGKKVQKKKNSIEVWKMEGNVHWRNCVSHTHVCVKHIFFWQGLQSGNQTVVMQKLCIFKQIYYVTQKINDSQTIPNFFGSQRWLCYMKR